MSEYENIINEQRELSTDAVLEVRNITRRFPGVLANDKVSMTLRRGEILALLGENGAGKSTLMNIIYGLYQQDEGEVYLNGKEVRFANPREAIGSGIGMVHQHFQLVDVMTVAENVVLGEEKETPTAGSLFSTLFTVIMSVLLSSLLLRFNDAPLAYDTFIFGLLTLVLPWYLGRYLFSPIGLSLAALAGIAIGVDAAGIGYPDQFLFVDGVIITSILLILYFIIQSLKGLTGWVYHNRKSLIRTTQLLAILVLMSVGSTATNPEDIPGAYTGAIADAFDGFIATEFEILMALLGMGIVTFLLRGVLMILTRPAENPGIDLRNYTLYPALPVLPEKPEPVLRRAVSMTTLGTIAIGMVALLTLPFAAGLIEDTTRLIAMREFLFLLSAGVAGTAVVAFIISTLFAWIFNNWEQTVGSLRVVWGLTWRAALISAVLWLGSQAQSVTQMGIITAMLQTDVPVAELEETDADNGTVGAGFESTTPVDLSWNRVSSQDGREAQINRLLEEIDDAFLNEDTGEYEGISRNLRESVDTVPPVVRDLVVSVLLLLIGAYAVSTWRGYQMIPGAVLPTGDERLRVSGGIIPLLILAGIVLYAVFYVLLGLYNNDIAANDTGFMSGLVESVESVPILSALPALVAVAGLLYLAARTREQVQLNMVWLGMVISLYVHWLYLSTESSQLAEDLGLGSGDSTLQTQSILLAGVGLLLLGVITMRMVAQRQQEPDLIRPISPFDSVIDAITDFIYTILSFRQTQAAAERVRELSQQYGLEVDPDAIVEKLPVGLQQRVEIVKALYRRADILILDEPTAVLTPQEGEELFKIMRELAAQGVSIIFITHKLKEVLKVATRVVVLRGGRVAGEALPADSTEASLAALMVGRDVVLQVDKEPAQPEAAILRVDGLHAMDDRGTPALQGVDFEVFAGEVLGIAGVQGNGQSELVEVLTGLRSMDDGQVELLGQELRPRHNPDASWQLRFGAAIIDALIVVPIALMFGYFWAYFGEGPASYELISITTLIVIVIIDTVYHLGLWIVPLLASRTDTPQASIDLDSGETVATANAAGQTIGQFMMNIQVTGIDGAPPSISALLIRYVLTPLDLLLFVPPLRSLLTGLQIGTHVEERMVITARKIKDLRTGHVPEDRLRFGLIKPFSVAENLILNDYYEAPHSREPSGTQLPFLSGVYAVLFFAVFGLLGYLWLDAWNDTLWNGLLDTYGVPEGSSRTVPTERGFNDLQEAYLNDPLVASLLILVLMTGVFTVISLGVTRIILRYIARPFSMIQPLMIMIAGYTTLLIIDALFDVIGVKSALLLPVFGLLTNLLIDGVSFSSATNSAILAGSGLVFFVLVGVIYERLITVSQDSGGPMPAAELTRLLQEHSGSGGLSLNVRDAVGYSGGLIQEYDIRTPSAMTSGGSLSGGNQQKLVVAREFSRQPRLLIASQPTRGIDVGSIEFIHKRIIQQRDRGAAVLLVSAELDEVMSLSDRIAVMYRGQIIKIVDAADASREELGLLMAGIAT